MTSHPIRPASLVFGLLIVLGTLGWFIRDHDLAGVREVAIGGAVALILAGIAGIALTLRRTS